jgi:serine protease AprX
MAVSISRALIDFVLLGSIHDRRQLQDSPILGDVWQKFARDPGEPVELLIAPTREATAPQVAVAIDDQIERGPDQEPSAEVAPLHGVVAACLYFREVLDVIVPMTGWWHSERIQKKQLQDFIVTRDDPPGAAEEAGHRQERIVAAILALARNRSFEGVLDEDLLPSLDRFLALAGLMLWAVDAPAPDPPPRNEAEREEALAKALEGVEEKEVRERVVALLDRLTREKPEGAPEKKRDLVFQVSLNRAATPALDRSVPAVKADAARRLFGVECSKIAWAVLDSGIQGDHPAFLDAGGKETRVQQSFDFANIRKIVSLDNFRENVRAGRLKELLPAHLKNPPKTEAEALDALKRLAEDARNGRSVQWELVQPFVEIRTSHRPPSDHGTHVAGIIGGTRKPAVTAPAPAAAAAPPVAKGAEAGAGQAAPAAAPPVAEGEGAGAAQAAPAAARAPDRDAVDGMCPDIQLYDFRVLAPDLKQTEFAIIAALQFIRFLNGRTDHTTIHGANLSLSIPHNVRNYACGRTPICMECERLVDSGVVVVAAAGNHGYQSFETRDGAYEGYAAYSITDPGNADGVITVGATHRHAPHTYGVSFFSSRGPTGDGRSKPDLVAPGERIRGPFRQGWDDLDGTSMAAPHVSGAAAMLMARYSEFIGQPRRIKTILCSSATDLGRERGFQGNGMLDVLRAFQSV